MARPPTTDDGRSRPEWGQGGAPAPGPGPQPRRAPGPDREPAFRDRPPAPDGKAKRAEAKRAQAQQAAAKRAQMEQSRSERALAKQARTERAGDGRPAAPRARGRDVPAGPPPRGRGAPAKAQGGGRPPAGRARRPEGPAPRPAAKRTGPRRKGDLRKRYGVVHDIEGPRVRLGVLWFVVALGALVLGPFTAALVYAPTAAVAAAQTARSWRKEAPRPSDVMAAAGAGLMGMGALFGAGGVGLAVLATVGLAFVAAGGDQRSPNPRIVDIGWTLQSALAPGAVAASMVLLCRLDQGSAIGLLLLVSAFETGDYLIGSGAVNPYEGPGAGAAGIVVITFILSTLPISALSFGQAWAFGGLVALLAPAGQLLASALLPTADSPASGLRRLDSLLIVAVLWVWGIGLVI